MDRIDLLKENQDLKKELEKHKKALDKACEELEEYDELISEEHGTECKNKNEWKEWCMDDE